MSLNDQLDTRLYEERGGDASPEPGNTSEFGGAPENANTSSNGLPKMTKDEAVQEVTEVTDR